MENEPFITLDFLRNDGKREKTRVAGRDLFQAREVAERVLQLGSGLYSEVDISIGDRWIEKIQHLDLVALHLDNNS